MALLVVSHWLLDLIVHCPDLPLSFSEETKLGFGLWNNKVLTIAVEMLIFFGGVMLYASSTKAKNKTGTYSLWELVVFFLLIYVMNLLSDPSPNAKAIGYVGLAQWLFVLWGNSIGTNRSATGRRSKVRESLAVCYGRPIRFFKSR